MNNDLRAKGSDFAEFLKSLPKNVVAKGNADSLRAAEAEYRDFQENFSKGLCYICRKSLESFSKKTPCPHWLLKPKGFKKNDLPLVAQHYGYFQIQSFLRWVANQEGFARNINDLPEEGRGARFLR